MSEPTRDRIVAAASRLLAAGGREAVSTRAVSAAADVQAPTIYRLFGDKRGLLDAVVAAGYASYVADKMARPPSADPVADLRTGWDQHLEFALANPALYVLMTEPHPGERPPALTAGLDFLGGIMHRVAGAGRLVVPEAQALQLFAAAGQGATLMVLDMPEDARDLSVSRLAREAIIAAITTPSPAVARPGPAAAAVALRAALADVRVLSPSEQALLAEWLDRIAGAAG